VDGFGITEHSPITNLIARGNIRRWANAFENEMLHNESMDDSEEKNGGPNHLGAWMRHRRMKGAKLAELLDTTPSVISELLNSKTQLSAKWLRRIAPHLDTTPGMLLDHDPRDLDADIVEIWAEADKRQKRQLTDIAKTIVGTGTNG
jgi:plasmid maintenance system antidote protein VapI